MTLIIHHLEFTATAVTELALDEQAGSAIRGALVGALWERFCANKAAPACAVCPLVRACPVAALVAPLREEGAAGGEQRPRPYVIQPPAGPRRYAPGDALTFRLVLFGPAAELFPYVVMAAQGLEQAGLGRRLATHGGRRGALRLARIAALNPLTGAHQPLYERDHPQVQAPGLPLTADAVAACAATLPTDRLTLTFLTPLRLIDGGRLVHAFAPRPFIQRLHERLDQLTLAYGDGAPRLGPEELQARLALAEAVWVAADATHWVDVTGYSSRQRRRLPMGGLVGAVTLQGSLAELREPLVWGSLIHVGKNAVKGAGWYRIVGGRESHDQGAAASLSASAE